LAKFIYDGYRAQNLLIDQESARRLCKIVEQRVGKETQYALKKSRLETAVLKDLPVTLTESERFFKIELFVLDVGNSFLWVGLHLALHGEPSAQRDALKRIMEKFHLSEKGFVLDETNLQIHTGPAFLSKV